MRLGGVANFRSALVTENKTERTKIIFTLLSIDDLIAFDKHKQKYTPRDNNYSHKFDLCKFASHACFRRANSLRFAQTRTKLAL